MLLLDVGPSAFAVILKPDQIPTRPRYGRGCGVRRDRGVVIGLGWGAPGHSVSHFLQTRPCYFLVTHPKPLNFSFLLLLR